MMFATTGEQRAMPCRTCGVMLIHVHHAQIGGRAETWDAPRHAAPCGKPCLGGGVSAGIARLRHYHGGRGVCGCPTREETKA